MINKNIKTNENHDNFYHNEVESIISNNSDNIKKNKEIEISK
jgi:hypothetical protein